MTEIMPTLPAPGSKVQELAAKIEQLALEEVGPVLAANPLFREKLRARCLQRAMERVNQGGRYSEPVQ